MNTFGDFNASNARRAHLALVQVAPDARVAADDARATGRAARVAETSAIRSATAYSAMSGSTQVEGARSRHEQGVRAIARNYANFEEALVPMVLASGVSGEAASAVASAIRSNPALRAQAERAFQRARLDAVN